jgi:membrane fusion protein, multidrug efflux system
MSLYPKKLAFICLPILCICFLSSCHKSSKEQASKPLPAVGIVKVTAEQVKSTIELAGRTTPFQVAEIRPQVTGILLQRIFTEGANVKENEPLYQIDPELYQAAVDQAQANAATLKLKYDRYKELIKVNAVSQQEFNDAEAAYLQSQAILKTASINLKFTKISSPIQGKIGLSSVKRGALVIANQAQALATVQQLDPIYVDIVEPTSELVRFKRELANGQLKQIDKNTVPVKLLLEDKSIYRITGKLEFTDVSVDQSTGTVTLRAIFKNPNYDLLPGMFVRAILEEGINDSTIVVPQQGVTHDNRGVATALVLKPDNTVELRKLDLGNAIGDKWVIKNGLQVGENLIVDGLQKVKPGDKARISSPSGETQSTQK